MTDSFPGATFNDSRAYLSPVVFDLGFPGITMLIIGLTGGICSGKSTVAELFSELGTPVIDADVVARELVEPGQAALQEIITQFGADILDSNDRLDRAKLRNIIFKHPADRKKLETIMHPRIRERMADLTRDSNAPYCIQVIPLLIETAQTKQVDRILLVDSSETNQKRRLAQRDHSSAQQISAILDSQADRQQRIQLADDIINNDGTVEMLRDQVRKLHNKYMLLSQKSTDHLHSQQS